MESASDKKERVSFQKKVWLATAIVSFAVIFILIIKSIFNVLLLLLAGALIAIYFRGLAGLIERKLRVPNKFSLPISVILSLLLIIGFFWLAGNRIQHQISELNKTLPAAIEKFRGQLEQSKIGQQMVQKATSGDSISKASNVIQSFFRSTFGVLGDIYVVLFLGIFFTASPKIYTSGLVALIPPKGKDAAAGLIEKLGDSLKKWLKGQLFAMFVVFVFTAIGLLIIGVPMWLVLALSAGLLNFIPNFGPLIAMIPAVLIGFIEGPTTALAVGLLYIVVQVVESNVVTPQIQQKLLQIPPALIIIAQLFMGVLTGGWGLVLATPLMVILMVVVQELYIKKQTG